MKAGYDTVDWYFSKKSLGTAKRGKTGAKKK
jgi:hypothetical protein